MPPEIIRMINARQSSNREILKLLGDIVDKYPELRFGQILVNLVKPNDGRDIFNEESVDTLARLKENIDAMMDNYLDADFLKMYCPHDKFFTCTDEVETIKTRLVKGKHLDDFSVEFLRRVRNRVVKFYHPLIRSDYTKDWMSSLQSVTAVIDHCIFKKGGEV